VFGQSVTFYFQCFESWSDNSGFVQFGVKDGLHYLYVRGGATIVAAIVTVVGNEATFAHAWYSVGITNSPFYNMTYGVVEVLGDVSGNSFEMAVAGIGMGYCGAQLKTNNSLLYIEGSVDFVPCQATDSACVEADDVTVYTTGCDTSSVSTFALPALGRQESFGSETIPPSQYPGGSENIIDITGDSSDSLRFGPTGIVAGVGQF